MYISVAKRNHEHCFLFFFWGGATKKNQTHLIFCPIWIDTELKIIVIPDFHLVNVFPEVEQIKLFICSPAVTCSQRESSSLVNSKP